VDVGARITDGSYLEVDSNMIRLELQLTMVLRKP
jgi:hypothetical protein